MCGLFGYLKKSDTNSSSQLISAIKSGAYISGLRGQDGAGMFSLSEENCLYYKKPFGISDFLDTSVASSILASIASINVLAYHTRKTTSGKNTQDATHPYINNSIIMMHNGSADKVGDEYFPHNKGFYSDSFWLSTKLDEATKDYKKFFESFVGEYALVWGELATKDFYIARNKDRPLSYIELDTGYLYASEASLLEYLVNRFDLSLKNKNDVPKEFDENTLYRFSNKTLEKVLKFKPPAVNNYKYQPYLLHDTRTSTTSNPTVPAFTRGQGVWFEIHSVFPNKRGSTYRGRTPGQTEVVFSTNKIFSVGDSMQGIVSGNSKCSDGRFVFMIKDFKKVEAPTIQNDRTDRGFCDSCGMYKTNCTREGTILTCEECISYGVLQ